MISAIPKQKDIDAIITLGCKTASPTIILEIRSPEYNLFFSKPERAEAKSQIAITNAIIIHPKSNQVTLEISIIAFDFNSSPLKNSKSIWSLYRTAGWYTNVNGIINLHLH